MKKIKQIKTDCYLCNGKKTINITVNKHGNEHVCRSCPLCSGKGYLAIIIMENVQ